MREVDAAAPSSHLADSDRWLESDHVGVPNLYRALATLLLAFNVPSHISVMKRPLALLDAERLRAIHVKGAAPTVTPDRTIRDTESPAVNVYGTNVIPQISFRKVRRFVGRLFTKLRNLTHQQASFPDTIVYETTLFPQIPLAQLRNLFVRFFGNKAPAVPRNITDEGFVYGTTLIPQIPLTKMKKAAVQTLEFLLTRVLPFKLAKEVTLEVGLDGGDLSKGTRVYDFDLLDMVSEACSNKSERSIIAQYYPGRSWLWQQWRGTIVRTTLPQDVLPNIIFAAVLSLFFELSGWKTGEFIAGVARAWTVTSAMTGLATSFMLSQSYGFWRSVYATTRKTQGRLSDIGMLCAMNARRNATTGRYTDESEALLKTVARYIRLFNRLFYASLTVRFGALRTPQGLSALIAQGELTVEERQLIIDAKGEGHVALLSWLTAIINTGIQDGRLCASRGYSKGLYPVQVRRDFTEKLLELRATYATLKDMITGRMPLAYVHLITVLTDGLILFTPFALMQSVGPEGVIMGTAVVTLFYASIMSLSKRFLDPLNNEVGDDIEAQTAGIDVATLMQETNLGSERFLKSFYRVPEVAWQPDRACELALGTADRLFDYLDKNKDGVVDLEDFKMAMNAGLVEQVTLPDASLNQEKIYFNSLPQQETIDMVFAEGSKTEEAPALKAQGEALQQAEKEAAAPPSSQAPQRERTLPGQTSQPAPEAWQSAQTAPLMQPASPVDPQDAETKQLQLEREARLKAVEAQQQAEETIRQMEREAKQKAAEAERAQAALEAKLNAAEEQMQAQAKAQFKGDEVARLQADLDLKLEKEEEARLQYRRASIAREAARLKAELRNLRLNEEEEARVKAKQDLTRQPDEDQP